jgi:hypothetical protein
MAIYSFSFEDNPALEKRFIERAIELGLMVELQSDTKRQFQFIEGDVRELHMKLRQIRKELGLWTAQAPDRG